MRQFNSLWGYVAAAVGGMAVGALGMLAVVSAAHSSSPASASTIAGPPTNVPRDLEFAGINWHWERPAEIADPPFTGHEYRCKEDSKLRLVDLDTPRNSKIFARVRRVEWLNPAGRFLKHGPFELTFKDGRRDVSHYRLDSQHGDHVVYAANGQMLLLQTYHSGMREGKGFGWSEDGTPLWEAEYENDKEVRGRSLTSK